MATRKEELKKLATEYMQAWNAGEEGRLDEHAHAELQVDYSHFGGTVHGIEGHKKMLRMTHGYFPDLTIQLKELIPNDDGDAVTVLWTYEGTLKGGELFGAEAAGQEVAVEGLTLLRIREGKVIHEKGVVDNLTLMMQLDGNL